MAETPGTLFSLYVGDLDPTVTEEHLVLTFSRFEGFLSAVLCTNSFNQRSLCYGYVNFHTLHTANRAIEALNHTVMNGKAIRVMWSQPNSEARLSGIGNVFVKNLAGSIDNLKLHEIFSKFGKILSCKVTVSEDGKSKGYGFVQYTTAESALNAIQKLNGCYIEGKELYVAQFIRRADRFEADINSAFNNLYIKNFDENMTEELLEEKFSKFGKITSLLVAKDANGISKGFGFVNFETSDGAKRAKETMHGLTLGSKVLYVARAQKKAERKAILRAQYDRMRKERALFYKGKNLYVKNINDDVDDMQLNEYFSQCGRITSAKVMQTDKGISRGFGFVCFSSPEEANRALNTLNGILFHGKPLHVAIAQIREERDAYIQMLYVNAKQATEFPGTNFAAYPTLYHRPLQMYQAPDFRPSGSNSLNGFAPLIGHTRPPLFPMVPNSLRQYGGRVNGHVNFTISNLRGCYQQQQQQERAGQAASNMTNGHAIAGAATNSTATSQSQEDLSTMPAAASPDQRKAINAQKLYPLVKKLNYNLSPKKTKMILETDNSERPVLLDSPESLAGKVEEAMKMLQLSETKAASNLEANGQFSEAKVASNLEADGQCSGV